MHANILICLYFSGEVCFPVGSLQHAYLCGPVLGKNANWLAGLVTPKESNDFNGVKKLNFCS